MKRRIHLKKRIFKNKKIKKINTIIIIAISLILLLFMIFKYVNEKLGPSLVSYAEVEVNRLASIIVSNAINKDVNESIDLEEIFVIEKDNQDKIQTIDYNSKIVNRVLIAASTAAQTSLKYLSEGKIDKLASYNTLEEMYQKYDKNKIKKGIIYEIPMGIAFNNPFLANLGPKIPVSFKLVGDITTNLNTKITSFGINSALLETSLYLKIKFIIVLPIIYKETSVEYNFPIVVKIIQSEIPQYYLNGYNQNSQILTLPVE